jgi:cellulose synthase operon protein C
MPPAKTLSPAELAKLEHAFATDPASDAYRPLAEAYLAMGRFMEAMVVCKKGVKAHATLTEPRILLARVYAEQAKDKKAIEELTGALQLAPNDKIALRMMGCLLIKTGELEPGKAHLIRAFEQDKSDIETQEAMLKAGVLMPQAAPQMQVQVPQPSHQALPPVPQQNRAAGAAPPSAIRPLQPRPVQARRSLQEESISELSEISDVRPIHKRSSGFAKGMFFLLIFVVPLSAAGYYGFGQYRAKQIREANKLNREANDKIKIDTFVAYKSAAEASESALQMAASDDTSRNARGLLAYSKTILWGEHQHDEATREAAEKNINEGVRSKEASAYLHSAEALFQFYSGKGDEALKKIEERIKAAGEKQVPQYYLTRGILQTNTGELEAARESLERAQAITPDDPRVFVALGYLHRRRGNDLLALTAFNNALKYSKNAHPDALVGTASLILDQDNPGNGYCMASKNLKSLLDMEPPPSPRQLALANSVKALLISRVSLDAPLFTNKEFVKTLLDCTQVDGSKAKAEIAKYESDGLALDRNNPEMTLVKGRRLFFEQKYDDSIAEIKKAVEASPKSAHYHAELAMVLMRKEGGDAAAEESLKKALALVPNSPKLLSMLGQTQFRQKKFDDAKQTLEKATADAKARNPEARYLLGKILRDQKKDYAKAAELLKRAGEEYFADPSLAAQAFDDLAQAYELKDDKDQARVSYEKALNADKEYSPAYCRYARFLAKLNDVKDKDKMVNVAKESLKLEPKGDCAAEMQKITPPS